MAEQLSVFLQNESGKIASVASLLAAGGIDIRALSIADTKDFGVLRMLVLIAAGLFFVVIGLVRRRGTIDEK